MLQTVKMINTNLFLLTTHAVGQLCVSICDPFSPMLHHNLCLTGMAVPLLQLFVEQHDVTVVNAAPSVIKVLFAQSFAHE